MSGDAERGLVIGVGNRLRGDDGVGPAVADALAGLDGVSVLEMTQLTPELATEVAAAPVVVIVDARVGVPPGSVHTARVDAPAGPTHTARVDAPAGPIHGNGVDVQTDPTDAGARPPAITHHVTPAQLLRLAGLAFGRVPPAFEVGIGVSSLDGTGGLSAPVAAAVPEAVAVVTSLLGARVAAVGR